MNNKKLCKLLLDNVNYGGVTVSKKGKVLTQGIAVALDNVSEYIIQPYTKPTKWHILKWLKFWKSDSSTAIGMWVTEGSTIYLDRIKVFDSTDLSGAISHASRLNQKAIHFLDQNITLWLTNPENTNEL